MLSSQLSSISKTSLCLHSSCVDSTALARASHGLSRKVRSHQQTRTFRSGVWSSYLDPGFQREIRHRPRVLKHKYAEAMSRKLLWDRHFPACPKHLGLKNFMCSALRESQNDSRPGGRWVNVDQLNKIRERTLKHIKELEADQQDAFEKMMNKRKSRPTVNLIGIRSRLLSHALMGNRWTSSKPTQYTSDSNETVILSCKQDSDAFGERFHDRYKAQAEPEYVIDPITNRKVWKIPPESSDLAPTRKLIGVSSSNFKGYRSQFQHYQPPSTASSPPEYLKEFEKENPYGPVYCDHLDGKPSKSFSQSHEGLKDYDDQVDYKSGQFYNPAAINKHKLDPVQKGLEEFDNKISQNSKKGPEALYDGTSSIEGADPACTGLEAYDCKVNYKSGAFYDPSRSAICYEDTAHCGLKEYDEKISGGPEFSRGNGQTNVDADPIQEAFESAQHSKKLERVASESNVEKLDPVEEAIMGFDPVLEELKDYESKLAEKKAEKGSEEAPLQKLDPVEEANFGHDPADQALKEYETKVGDGLLDNTPRIQLEKTLNEYDSRTDYGRKGALRIPWRRNNEDLSTLNEQHSAVEGNHPKMENVSRRQALENEFDKLPGPETSREEVAAAEKVRESRQAQIRGVDPSMSKSGSRKFTGNYLRDFPEEFKIAWAMENSVSSLILKSSTDELPMENPPYVPMLYASDPNVPRIETSLDRSISRSVDQRAPVSEGAAKAIADFAQPGEGDLSVFVSSYGSPNQSSTHLKDEAKNKSETSRRLEKENGKDLIRELRGIYEDTYGTIDTKHRQLSSTSSSTESASPSIDVQPFSEAPEPTLYKILAYDPTMQSISTAETTSIVPDSSGPLTPAEVLLRLSNPGKFFPHFKQLQSEGYEIVSGSGDVLVFRKVRSAESRDSVKLASTTHNTKQAHKMKTNPIDGMRSTPMAATGNFASPTGFVNHDLPSDPPFKSNIDMRREEPVFSGKRNWEDDSESTRQKSSRGKRILIGAAWVAGCSYAVGVVAEFFRTGGIDGMGPQGF